MTRRTRPLRTAIGLLGLFLFFGLPFLFLGGESAIRFDLAALRLHWFGTTLWVQDFYPVLLGTLFLTFLLCLGTMLFGRIWCGWLCPQTILCDVTGPTEKPATWQHQILSHIGIGLLSLILGSCVIWYFVPPREFLQSFLTGNPSPVLGWSVIVLTSLFFFDLVILRRTFCSSICPYARLQSVLFDEATLTIAFDQTRKPDCIDCEACVRHCPVKIDIRSGGSSACIHCAECIDQCSAALSKTGKPPLIDYAWGAPGGRRRFLRPGTALFGAFSLLSLALLLISSAGLGPMEMMLLPNPRFSPRRDAAGNVVQSSLLSIQNKAGSDLSLELKPSETNPEVKISPKEISLNRNETMKKVPLFILYDPGTHPQGSILEIILVCASPSFRMTKKLKVSHEF